MIYNIHYDICACLIFIFTIAIFFYRKNMPIAQNRLFLLMLAIGFLNALSDILSGIGCSYPDQVSKLYLWGVNMLYYITLNTMPFVFTIFCFSIVDANHSIKITPKILFLCLPYVVAILLILTTPFTKLIFYVTDTYYRNKYIAILYGIFAFYLVSSICILFMSKQKISLKKKFSVSTIFFLSIIGVSIQFFFPTFLVLSFAISMSFLIMLVFVQKPEDLVDSITDQFNRNAFYIMSERDFSTNKDFYVVAVIVDDLPFLDSAFGTLSINELLKKIGLFLQTNEVSLDDGRKKTQNQSIFHIKRGFFCLLFSGYQVQFTKKYIDIIQERLTQSWKIDLADVKIATRICTIACPKDFSTTEEILNMFSIVEENKQLKNRRFISPNMIEKSVYQRQAYVENALKFAIQENRLSVWYQPLYSTCKKRIIGAEALVRLQGVDGKSISPDEFIPIAEQNGMILRIGQFVFESVCRFFALYKLDTLGVDMLDINLSIIQCMHDKITDQIIEITNLFNINPKYLNLEITETAAMSSPDTLLHVMKTLRDHNFRFSLDDYGSGYANANYVLNLPFSHIKIDKEFVQKHLEDPRASIILQSTIEMMKKLGLNIIAEGVETNEMVENLSNLGCDFLQGYYFSKPISEEDFLQLIKKNNKK